MSEHYFSLNGERTALAGEITIAELVADQMASTAGCAVARNGEVIPRSEWSRVVIVDNDVIELLTVAQGG